MEDKDRLEFLRWLIERSDGIRASYANRASLILSADALVLGTIAFILDKTQTAQPRNGLLIILLLVSLASMLASFLLAFAASVGFRRRSVDYSKSKLLKRNYFNATDTINTFKSIDELMQEFRDTSVKQLIENAGAEVWVSYTIQRRRYRRLKASLFLLLMAVCALVIGLCLAFFFG